MKKSKQVLELVEKIYSLYREMVIKNHLLHDLDMNDDNATDLKNEISELKNKSIMYTSQRERFFEMFDFQGEKSTKKQPKIFIVENDIQRNRFVDISLKGVNYANS